MKKIVLILGTRPQIIKSSTLIRLAEYDPRFDFSVIHTGQHYDYEMTDVFFDDFKLPDPVANLGVGSGTRIHQISKIMSRLEKLFRKDKPDLVLVPGDTNSTLAGTKTASNLGIPVGHIEAGARSYDLSMPEEINRRLTDQISTLFFTPTKTCTNNLVLEKVSRKKIHQVGDTMYDVLLSQLPKADKSDVLEVLNLTSNQYAVITTHRQENVDDKNNLSSIVDAIIRLDPLPFVFLLHPRTLKKLRKFNLYSMLKKHDHIYLLDPVGYHDSIHLIKNAKLVLTDSGGIQKEAYWTGTPCITLRDNTEWIETLLSGVNSLSGADTHCIVQKVIHIIKNEGEIRKKFNEYTAFFGRGDASKKILDVCNREI